jgi:hypothetical protein
MIVKSSDLGALGVLWSGTDSRCIRKCPGYNKVDRTGDDRIGVGVTRHKKSTDPANLYKVAWDDGNLNSWQIKEFDGSVSDNFFNPISESLNPSDYSSNRAGTHFILARKCQADGSWEEPIILCPGPNGRNSEDQLIVNSSKSYIVSTINNNSYGGSKNYIKANDSGEYFSTVCKGDYLKQTDSKLYSGNKYETPRLVCVNNSGANNFVDKTFIQSNGDQGRRDCVKYCSTDSYRSATVSLPSGEKIRAAGTGGSDGRFTGTCGPNYLTALNASGVRSGANPVVTCVGNDDNPMWSQSIENDCSQARNCGTFSKTNPTDAVAQTAYVSDGMYWYLPIINYMSKTYLDKVINHGDGENFPPIPNDRVNDLGRCGSIEQRYCAAQTFSDCWEHRHHRRKMYLKSWSCNDGTFNYDVTWGSWTDACGNFNNVMSTDGITLSSDRRPFSSSDLIKAKKFIKDSYSVPVLIF